MDPKQNQPMEKRNPSQQFPGDRREQGEKPGQDRERQEREQKTR